MQRLFIAALSAAIALTAPATAASLQSVHADHFTVMMPGTPETRADEMRMPGGVATIQSWTLSSDAVHYSVGTIDYPVAYVKARPVSEFLSEARNGLAVQLKGSVTSETPVSLSGNPGTSFSVTSDNGEVKARAFLVGTRLYTLMVLYSASTGAPDADKFLTSLHLKG